MYLFVDDMNDMLIANIIKELFEGKIIWTKERQICKVQLELQQRNPHLPKCYNKNLASNESVQERIRQQPLVKIFELTNGETTSTYQIIS